MAHINLLHATQPSGSARQAMRGCRGGPNHPAESVEVALLCLATMLRGHGPSPVGPRRCGYIPCDSRAADLLYNIVSRRHTERSTIISTNLAFKQWGAVFPGAACVAALVDRFNQHCHKLVITADSWRETHPLDHDHEKPRIRSDRVSGGNLVDRQITTEFLRRLHTHAVSPFPRLPP